MDAYLLGDQSAELAGGWVVPAMLVMVARIACPVTAISSPSPWQEHVRLSL
jgi:hypothetical protein